MKVLIITSSPNKDGLTAACGEQARLGATASGAEATVVSLNELDIEKCRACNNGWGTCLGEGTCQTQDDFQKLHASLKDYDAFILVTPVYWMDLSESAKAFMDRLRRCEAFKKADLSVSGKPVICVAAAGGTGNGFVSCLTTMEKFVEHMKGVKYDLIGITRRSKEYKLITIYEAAKSMTAGKNIAPRI
ncbi:MAG: flavodoxin family protein [Bacillota bacterium]